MQPFKNFWKLQPFSWISFLWKITPWIIKNLFISRTCYVLDLDVFLVWAIMIDRAFQFKDQEDKANVFHLSDHFQFAKVQNENLVSK